MPDDRKMPDLQNARFKPYIPNPETTPPNGLTLTLGIGDSFTVDGPCIVIRCPESPTRPGMRVRIIADRKHTVYRCRSNYDIAPYNQGHDE